MTKYIEIEFIEGIENVYGDWEDRAVVTTERGSSTHYTDNVIALINEFSADGWEVVSSTDTFNYIEKTMLQRRKCYLLRKT